MVSKEIVEIKERCEEGKGILRPFICETEDGGHYYAKGSNALASGLVKEWVCANLAVAFGLPVPDMAVLYLDPALRDLAEDGWQTDLRFMHLFGLKSVSPCDVLSLPEIEDVPAQLQRDVIVFDAWIRNSDRYLTQYGGNPNLLLEIPSKRLQVIDHNLAFDQCFEAQDLLDLHAFREVLWAHPIDLVERADYCSRFERALENYDVFASGIPEEWLESLASGEGAIVTDIRDELGRYTRDDFWGWLP